MSKNQHLAFRKGAVHRWEEPQFQRLLFLSTVIRLCVQGKSSTPSPICPKSHLYCSDIVKYGEAIRDNKIVTNKKSRKKELEGAEADRWEMAAALLRRVRISRGAQQLQLRSSGGSEQKAVWRGGIEGLPSRQVKNENSFASQNVGSRVWIGPVPRLYSTMAKAVEWLFFSQTPPKSHCAQLFPVFAWVSSSSHFLSRCTCSVLSQLSSTS